MADKLNDKKPPKTTSSPMFPSPRVSAPHLAHSSDFIGAETPHLMVRRRSVVDLLALKKDASSGLSNSRYHVLKQTEDLDEKKRKDKIFQLMASYLSTEVEDIEQFIANHVEYTLARSRFTVDDTTAYHATAYSIRDRLIEFQNDAQQYVRDHKSKMVYYFSIEYLLGRSLQNAVTNLGLKDQYGQALRDLGYRLEDVYEKEQDAALGNGGLGRLAACFLDSLATLNYAGWGYGLRYQYGMFKQSLHDGYQVETPDYWLGLGNPWEVRRHDKVFNVRMYGQVRSYYENDRLVFSWEGGESVLAQAVDMPVAGYGTLNVGNLRLWDSRPSTEFNFDAFNSGDYYEAIKQKQESENITSVLYPNDSTYKGKELRLKQQYFFASASLQDIFRRYKQTHNDLPVESFASKVAIQLNDTHPTVAIPELMRILIDNEKLSWDTAWKITTNTFAYTNHTVLPEALEKWEVPMFEKLLPRHIQIIYEINRRFMEEVAAKYPNDPSKLSRLSLIEESTPKRLRMAHLAVVGSHSVNGVAAIHTEIIKKVVFKDFYELWPEKFNNKTNGVTPRRWVDQSNPGLSSLITQTLGNDEWVTHFELIAMLRHKANDAALHEKFHQVKFNNKKRLADIIKKISTGNLEVNPHALFDIHVKRIHEYKRQLLNILSVIHRYLWLKSLPAGEVQKQVPRVVIFAGKAAPGYQKAKMIIKLINNVANTVNRDCHIGDILKVVFLPNYNVSLAEIIIPACDISQQISTAGTEASGTSNMKFAMNGGLILGTLDGANIEIRDEVGPENVFIFGALADEVEAIRHRGPSTIDKRLAAVLSAVQKEEHFGQGSKFDDLLNPLWQGNDYYLLAHDFASYLDAQKRIDECYRNKTAWVKKAIMTVAGTGKFSSDRTINEYAREIWGVTPCGFNKPQSNNPSPIPSHPPFLGAIGKSL